MRKKGFTLVELLVVIAIIALLMGILMPALAQVRRLAQRMMCGTNLSGIGKAMMVYANDNDEDYPKAGGKQAKWSTTGSISNWDAAVSSTPTPESVAFGSGTSAKATVTSSFFLLVKYADCTPKQFVCKGDGAKTFKLTEVTGSTSAKVDELADAHDFGGITTATDLLPGQYVSYSYNASGARFAVGVNISTGHLSVSTNPSQPVCADRNPFIDKNARKIYVNPSGGAVDSEEKDPVWQDNDLYDPDKVWNSAAHQREGQNVLFADAHVEFEKKPNIGIENDNIWKYWGGSVSSYLSGNSSKENRQFGTSASDGIISNIGNTSAVPGAEQDAFLINEYNGKPPI